MYHDNCIQERMYNELETISLNACPCQYHTPLPRPLGAPSFPATNRLCFLFSLPRTMATNEKWKAIVARKQAEREARIPTEWRIRSLPPASQTNVLDIPRTCGILSPAELQITETTDATALLEHLKTGRAKSLDVVTAFCKRAAIAQQLVSSSAEN